MKILGSRILAEKEEPKAQIVKSEDIEVLLNKALHLENLLAANSVKFERQYFGLNGNVRSLSSYIETLNSLFEDYVRVHPANYDGGCSS
ncbi:Uncharacterised protein [Candidatus Tiddalikarchaeum anstoanum]|nr:Uncharacterised protein [Candidatus Tiddalikarchaeum anstoanum]